MSPMLGERVGPRGRRPPCSEWYHMSVSSLNFRGLRKTVGTGLINPQRARRFLGQTCAHLTPPRECDMSVPQTKDRPASALRAVFAGIGSLLSVKDKWSGKDKVRAKPAAEAPADDAAPVAEAVAPETTAE